MDTFKLKRINTTDEVLAKLMNSAAEQYDCRIEYKPDTNQVTNDCTNEVKPYIIVQVAGIFGIQLDN